MRPVAQACSDFTPDDALDYFPCVFLMMLSLFSPIRGEFRRKLPYDEKSTNPKYR
jgi:hypothetical protein